MSNNKLAAIGLACLVLIAIAFFVTISKADDGMSDEEVWEYIRDNPETVCKLDDSCLPR